MFNKGYVFFFSQKHTHVCHRSTCFLSGIHFQKWWRWNAISNLMGLISLACNCYNWNTVTVCSHVTSIINNALRTTWPHNNVKWRTSVIHAYFEDSIFNGSSKIQWQEKSFHHMEGHFFHRFKWDILQRHDNTDCIALTDQYRFAGKHWSLLSKQTWPDSLMTNLQAYT